MGVPDRADDHRYSVAATRPIYQGTVIAVRHDEVAMPGGGSAGRDVVVHPGAVGIVAFDAGRVLLVTQYRHPVRRRLAELPAGLLDVAGEPALDAAKRELAEEAGLAAETWHVLVDALTSPGMTDEAIRIYLARDLHEVERPEAEHEELELSSSWCDLGEAVRRVFAGELENAMACLGILAAHEAARSGFDGLRPAEDEWTARPLAR